MVFAVGWGNPERENPFPPEGGALPRCPACGAELDVDTEVYYREGEPVGCQYCTRSGVAERMFYKKEG